MGAEGDVPTGEGEPVSFQSSPSADPAAPWTPVFVFGRDFPFQPELVIPPNYSFKYPGAQSIPEGPFVGNAQPAAPPDPVTAPPANSGSRGDQAAPAARSESGLVKVSMNFTVSTIDTLRSLSKKQGTTMTEIVRRAIGLQNFVTAEIEAGGKILVEDARGKVKRVILP